MKIRRLKGLHQFRLLISKLLWDGLTATRVIP